MTTTRVNPHDVVRAFDAAKAPRGIAAFLGGFLTYPGLAWTQRELVGNFFWRDLMGRFRGSFLGAGWTLVQPVFLFSVYYLVFGFLLGSKTGDVGPGADLAIWMFSGIIAFNALQEATNAACSSVLNNGNLVKKVAFPSELLPLSSALIGSVIFLVGLVVAVVVGLVLGQVRVTPLMGMIPLVVVLHFVLVLGIGMTLATSNVFVRDTSHLYSVFAQGWFFLSPLFWYPSMVRDALGDVWLGVFQYANPAYALLMLLRQALGIAPQEISTSPYVHLAISAVWASVLFIFGLAFFRSRKARFPDLI